MAESLTFTRLELGLGSIIEQLRDLGATSITIPSQLAAATSPNLATGAKDVPTSFGTSSINYTAIFMEDYPATFVGGPTTGVRGTLPDGRAAVTLDGATQYLTVSGRVAYFATQVLIWSPLTTILFGLTLVVIFKGGNAGEPLMCRSDAGTTGDFGLFTDAMEMHGDRDGTHATFTDASDASNWVMLVMSMTASTLKVWKNKVEQTLSGTTNIQGGNRSTASALQTLYIGRNVSGSDFFTGSIALAAIIPASITQAEADALYDATQWTDVSADLAGWSGINWEYGLPGDRPDDVVARTGEFSCTLKNSAGSSGGVAGYYSPGHANCRSGFKPGIPMRWSLGYDGTTYYKFRGRLDSIQPAAGLRGALGTRLRASDWMEEAAVTPLARIGTETNLRADEALKIALDGMVHAPAACDFDTGRDTFPYVFDSAPSSNSPVLGELSRIVRSERGYLYPVGDTTGGGTLRFENRHHRPLTPAIAATLDNSMFEIEAGRSRRDIITACTVTIHPRRIDPSASTLLYELPDDVSPRIGPGETIQWRAGYRDPDSPIARIGGTNIVAPVASTDYVMNTAADGSGADVTASMTVVFEHAGVYGVFRITNTTGSDAYVRTLQIRGKGLYQYADLLCRAEDLGKIATYGENHQALDMAYQTDPQVGQGVADWVQTTWSRESTGVSRLSFLANLSSALMLAALAVEPGQGVDVREDVTGIAADPDGLPNYYVHRVRYSLTDGGIVRVTWTLAPADRERFWILDEVGSSELDETTRLAYA